MTIEQKRSKFPKITNKALRRVRQVSFFRKKFVLLLIVGSIIGLIVFMNLGGSTNTEYTVKSENIAFEGDPTNPDIPNQGTEGVNGGFNLTNDFGGVPTFTPPAGLAGQYDESFGENGDFGDLDSIYGDPGEGIGSDLNVELPPIDDFPVGEDLPTEDPSTGGGEIPLTNDLSGGKGNNKGPDVESDPEGVSGNSKNVTLPDREVKGRNLPVMKSLSFSSVSINLPGLPKFTISFDSLNSLFVLILGVSLFINKAIVPSLIQKLEEEGNESSIFIKPDVDRLRELKAKKARQKKLLLFQDHVDELIARSLQRVENYKPSDVIVTGYHELDLAFNEFSQLTRTKDTTPLEHARKHFETGEISNEVLERIVDLFYLTRFGLKELDLKDIYIFIDLLSGLVIQGLDVTDLIE